MKTVFRPSREDWPSLCRRAEQDDAVISGRVREILSRIKSGGEPSLREIVKEIEGAVPADFRVYEAEILAAGEVVPQVVKEAVREAKKRIEAFHRLQKPEDISLEENGIICRRRFVPIERVGLYIPGGSAPLFSTILMLAVPASLAGCRETVLCTPQRRDGSIAPEILFTASLCGIREIYRLGGAQAIAAMAYGTGSIRPVDKIFGPGNRYVMKAKQLLCAEGVAIDMPAGPSEVMVLADESADPSFVASDLLSQAEHGPDSQVMLVTCSESLSEAVSREVDRQLALLPRRSIADSALENSRAVILDSREEIVDFANCYAAEHLIICMEDPWEVADRIRAAGSIFIGNYSPESAGDYASGTNHTLPTMGCARAFSGIGTESFMHGITYQELSRSGLRSISDTIVEMAEAEGLQAHAEAVRTRLS